MTASYPAAIREFTTKRNLIDIVWAEHMNSMQDETRAIQSTLGVVPQIGNRNPGNKAPNHGTVAARIQSVARGEQWPVFRGSVREATVAQGTWGRPSLRADDDDFSMSTGTGIRLCEAGIWLFVLKCDWKSTSVTVAKEAVRMLRLEINGSDIGVRDILQELPYYRSALHTQLVWTDEFPAGTTVSMGVRTDCDGNPGALTYNAYMRAHLVRCHEGDGSGGSIPFEPLPETGGPNSPPRPPDCDVRPPQHHIRYTCFVELEWFSCYGPYPTGHYNSGPGAGHKACVIDNTHPEFSRSPYPSFETRDEAEGYARQLENRYYGGEYPSHYNDIPVTG